MENITINIKGMHCQGCVKTVSNALSNIKGVKAVIVSLENKNAVISFEGEIKKEDLISAVNELGFEAK